MPYTANKMNNYLNRRANYDPLASKPSKSVSAGFLTGDSPIILVSVFPASSFYNSGIIEIASFNN